MGREIDGKRVGVVGLGNVGSRVANASCELGMDVCRLRPVHLRSRTPGHSIARSSAWARSRTSAADATTSPCTCLQRQIPSG
ncbi:MAG: NAD(P)-dependent oxidoreductase [Collinsella sp.]